MPNWCCTNIKLKGKEADIEAFMKKHIINDEFDFETVIPFPNTKEECDPTFIVASAQDAHISEDPNRPWFNWYKWSLVNWGTKWNASSTSYLEDFISFQTAWSPPVPIYNALVKQHPELDFEFVYAEEQVAVYTGKYIASKGSFTSVIDYKSESKEAFELYFEIWGGEEDFIFDPKINTYVLQEDYEEEN